jgi:hypothetical protein
MGRAGLGWDGDWTGRDGMGLSHSNAWPGRASICINTLHKGDSGNDDNNREVNTSYIFPCQCFEDYGEV